MDIGDTDDFRRRDLLLFAPRCKLFVIDILVVAARRAVGDQAIAHLRSGMARR